MSGAEKLADHAHIQASAAARAAPRARVIDTGVGGGARLPFAIGGAAGLEEAGRRAFSSQARAGRFALAGCARVGFGEASRACGSAER